MELLLISFGILIVVYLLLINRFQFWTKKGIVGPKPIIPFGNVGQAIFLKTGLADICTQMYSSYKDCKYIGFFNMWQPCLLIRDPEIIKDILIKDFRKFPYNWIQTGEDVDPILGRNPFVLRENWKTIRSQVTPLLTPGKIKLMLPLILQVCENMKNYIKNNQEHNAFDANDFAIKYTSDNVYRCALGLEGNAFKEKNTELLKLFQMMSAPETHSGLLKMLSFFFPKLSSYLGITFIGPKVPKIFYKIVEDTIKYRKENHVVYNDYLDSIMKITDTPNFKYTREHIIANAFTFFLDGVETSAAVLAFVLYELAANPAVQEKARLEIVETLEKHDGVVTFENIQEMTYVHNVILETLRKYPPILFIARQSTEDYILPPYQKNCNVITIKKGTPIFISVEGIHWDPEYYVNPEQFDPARFSEENKDSRPKCAFLGFGEGPKICLGKTFALLQLKVCLAYLLSDFELRLNAKTDDKLQKGFCQFFITIKSKILIDIIRKE